MGILSKYLLHYDGKKECVAFNGSIGESVMSDKQIVKSLNGFNDTCIKYEEQIKLLRQALKGLVGVGLVNEEMLADRLFREFDESRELVSAKEALSATEISK